MARLLIIEDETDLREVWAEELGLMGNRVQSAADGVEGWESVQRELFDLVVLDLNLPRQSGLETLRLIRRHDPHLPVIVVTANTTPEVVRKVIAAGANDILFKPVALSNLTEAIARLARQSPH
jgi:two-component system OmpR family response regulator